MRQPLANAAIAGLARRLVAGAARRMSPLWPLARIQGRPGGATGHLEDAANEHAVLQHLEVLWFEPIDARLKISGPVSRRKPAGSRGGLSC